MRGPFSAKQSQRSAGYPIPESSIIDIFNLAPIPLYNAHRDTDEHRPEAVERLKSGIAKADALLIATPEYNHSVPGVLQNAIDWASRPGMRSPLAGKPVAIMGASPGAVGTARAQQQLKLVLASILALVMPHPGVLVGGAGKAFSSSGELTDETTRRFVASFLADLAQWSRRVGAPAPAATGKV